MPTALLKRDSSTGAFLWNLRNFERVNNFYRILPQAASEEWIEEEVRNFRCLYDKNDKGNRAKEKKNIYIYIEKRTHGLGVVCINGGGSALFFAIF